MSVNKDFIQKQALKSITIRYIFAVALIAAFSTVAFLFNKNLHHQMAEDFKVINLSGRQRMLTQRIALLIKSGKVRAASQSLKEYDSGLKYLIKSRFLASAKHDFLHNIYFEDGGIIELSSIFLNLASEPSREILAEQELFEVSQSLLTKYDSATFLTQQISEADYHEKLLIEIFIYLSTIGLLILEILGIFVPMVKRVASTFRAFNNIEKQSYLNSRLALIGETVSSLGHEMATSLSVVQNCSEMLLKSSERKKPIEECQGLIELLNKHTHRMGRMLQSLKNQARNAQTDRKEKVDFKLILKDALELFSNKIKINNIEIMELGKENLEIEVKPAEFSQVISNLISNAIDSLCELPKEVRKKIIIEYFEDSDNHVTLRVSDNGKGVSAEIQDRIFESFVTSKPYGKGTGLGLAVSKKIVEEHEGTIHLNTEISRSCFEINLPKAALTH